MRTRSALRVRRSRGGWTAIEVTGDNPQAPGVATSISIEFDKAGVRAVVRDLCEAAGLPDPCVKS